jgi:hypothetical protein
MPATSSNWVARGTPRPAFVAGSLPMQDLYNPALAEHHLAAQRDRGGLYPAHLPAPLGDKRSPDAHPQASTRRRPGPKGTNPGPDRPQRPADAADRAEVQLLLEDL